MNIMKALIIEDEFIIATDLKGILEEAGFHITGLASSYEMAEVLFNNDIPDVIFSDIYIKGDKTGIDFVLDVKKKHSPAPFVIVISAYSEAITIEKAMDTSPIAYITKPFTVKQVLASVNIAKQLIKKRKENFPSPREIEIISLLSQGNSSKIIAEKMSISYFTVETHRKNIMKKYNLHTSLELIALAFENKWL